MTDRDQGNYTTPFILPTPRPETGDFSRTEMLHCPRCDQVAIIPIVLFNEAQELADLPGTVEIPMYVCCLICGFQQRYVTRYLNVDEGENGES